MGKETRYETTVRVSQQRLDAIRRFLEEEPPSESECLGEDETIVETAMFPDGTEADVKCCGVRYREGGSNTAWTEMVLFRDGSEIGHTEPSDEFEGRWEYTAGDGRKETAYVVNVVPEKEIDYGKLNKDADTRDRILFGGRYDEGLYSGGTRPFGRVAPGVIAELVEKGFAPEDERQGDSSSIREFLEYAKEIPGITFSGYAVSRKRSDCRVTVNAAHLKEDADADAKKRFTEAFSACSDSESGCGELWAWWD